MRILIVNRGVIPAYLYGGTERVIWSLGKELSKLGHEVTFLVFKGSSCDFASVIPIDPNRLISEQIPHNQDLIHFNFMPSNIDRIMKPHVITIHGNGDLPSFNKNIVFVSKNHASRFGSDSYIHNGLDWAEYDPPNLSNHREYFHFLGNAAWRVKNVQGAIDVINKTKHEKLKVLGGYRLNLKMGFRFTLSTRSRFHGMVGGTKKNRLINGSKGLINPVKWHEPFGLSIIESLFYGCPVFGTTHGSFPELVNSDVGFLSNSATSLARAIENSGDYSRQYCHDYAVEKFNSVKMTNSYLAKYEKVLNGETLNADFPVFKKTETNKYLEWSID